MKNADMKVIAILLSIALLFTLFTTNFVAVASLFVPAASTLLTGLIPGAEGSGTTNSDGTGDSTYVPGNSNNTNTNNNSTNTNNNTNNNTNTNNDANTNNGGDQQGSTGDVNSDDPVIKDPYAFYSKAANDIHTNGTAGYNKISWQTPLKIEGLGLLDSVIVPILEGFMTTEDEAKVQNNPKGSDDAKNRMPASNASAQWIKSATAQKNGDNYTVVIVLADATNPSYADTDGYPLMTREFLDYKDVEKEAKNISIVKSLEGEILYKDYTITAEMTADGKFISITHKGVGYMKANLNGSINANGELEFNAKYTDFAY